MINRDHIRKWIQSGINDDEPINFALLLSWNLVCPMFPKMVDNESSIMEWNERGQNRSMQLKQLLNDEKEKKNVVGIFSSKALTNSQIRIVFGEMRRIQSGLNLNNPNAQENKTLITSFLLLKPKLAYSVKRHDKPGIKLFYDFFVAAYDSVEKSNTEAFLIHFQNFMQLMEAVLAFHKFHGGKE